MVVREGFTILYFVQVIVYTFIIASWQLKSKIPVEKRTPKSSVMPANRTSPLCWWVEFSVTYTNAIFKKINSADHIEDDF